LLGPLVVLGSVGVLAVFFTLVVIWRLLFPFPFQDAATEIKRDVQSQEVPEKPKPDSSGPAEFTPVENRIERALRTALLGLLAPMIPRFPLGILLTLAFESYAIWLLLPAISEWNALSHNSRHRFVVAWLFLFLAIFPYIFFYGMIILLSNGIRVH
jgi:hypothetical protein